MEMALIRLIDYWKHTWNGDRRILGRNVCGMYGECRGLNVKSDQCMIINFMEFSFK